MFGLRTSLGRALEPVGAIVAGVIVAHVAEPALADGGRLAGSVGVIIGTGAGRGAALTLAVVGLILIGLGIWLAQSMVRRQLAIDSAPAESSVSDAVSALVPVTGV
jgi:hypothetical protein